MEVSQNINKLFYPWMMVLHEHLQCKTLLLEDCHCLSWQRNQDQNRTEMALALAPSIKSNHFSVKPTLNQRFSWHKAELSPSSLCIHSLHFQHKHLPKFWPYVSHRKHSFLGKRIFMKLYFFNEMFKVRLGGAQGNLVWWKMPLPMAEGLQLDGV